MKRNFFLLFSILISLNTFSQGKVIGKDINDKYQKTLRLISLYNEKYYKNFAGDSSTINSGQYIFNIPGYGKSIPLPFRFLFKTERNKVFDISELFYISHHTNIIKFDSETKKIILDKNDSSYHEINDYNTYLSSYLFKKNKIDSIQNNIYKRDYKVGQPTIDSLQELYAVLDRHEDSLLLNMANKIPKSYVLFWKIVGKFESKGFKQEYLNIFNNLHPTIKKSSVGLIFENDLKKAKKTALGNTFPNLNFQNKKILSTLGKSYTLIDFWFSYCAPCLEQMPAYREIYSQYKYRGFEIVNISTDRTKDLGKWKKVIQEQQLNWVHYLDENGIKAKHYMINKFPSNFLLDSSGKIIKKDISPEKLNIFLSENIN
ncbi:peroxiredoxin family protein [Chryseobacterium populi]|uniref:Peroxiredoxin n=1 Tax=Chryseobacterium populi TaxID=1144316 RepID=J2T1I2_9FLAO|nr:TlpA disulfide reductase family protein [Chryseobacterium populi]EJL71837.1 Peroxiredoxin [Chryseobacterium populi]